MIADMVQQHQLVPANQLLPHLGPNHGGMLWHWTQLAGVLHHWGNLTWLTAHPLNAWAQSVLRTSIWKDLADNFCRFEVNRVFFQERILAFMSEVCSLILIKMENGVLPVSLGGGSGCQGGRGLRPVVTSISMLHSPVFGSCPASWLLCTHKHRLFILRVPWVRCQGVDACTAGQLGGQCDDQECASAQA